MVSDTTAEKITPLPPLAPTPQTSAFSRGALLAYLLLIAYASLYPFTGWQSMGLPLGTYLMAGLPRYWTGFDVAINVLGYVPLGILTVFSLHPKIRRISAILLALFLGIVLSGAMEAAQTLLPNRVASNLDFVTNSVGAFIGALIGNASSHMLLERSRLRYYKQRWFSTQANRGLIIFALWPLAQIYPQSYLFGNGQVLPILSDWLSLLLEMPVDLGSWARNGAQLSVEQYWLAEAIITALSMSGALLALLCMLRDKAPRVILLIAFLSAALAIKTLATALFFAPEHAFTWLTPGAQGGVLLGLGLLTGFAFLPSSTQRRSAVALLIAALIAVNLAPTNPYFIATLETWVQGKFLNFNGAAQFLSLLWTVAALWFLLHATHRVKRT